MQWKETGLQQRNVILLQETTQLLTHQSSRYNFCPLFRRPWVQISSQRPVILIWWLSKQMSKEHIRSGHDLFFSQP